MRTGRQNMELRHLVSFTKSAERQSFTRAAEELSVTQAAISQHIAALEKELNVSLFERAGRTVIPTEAGQRFYEYAQQILNLVEEARNNLSKEKTSLRGTLQIATSTVPAETILPELLESFFHLHPDIRESVTVSDSKTAAQTVETGKADVALIGSLPEDLHLSASPLCSDDLVFLVAPDHPLAAKKRITLKQIWDEPLILREPGSGSRRCIEQALQEQGTSLRDLKIIMEVNSNDAIRSSVQRGLGATFLSKRIVERDLSENRLCTIPVQGIQFKRQLYLVTNPDRLPTAPLRAFLDFIEQWVKKTG